MTAAVIVDEDQADWGSRLEYDDGDLSGLWLPDTPVGHWGGHTVPAVLHINCRRIVRGWQRYHIDSKGWRDLAYNYLFCNHGVTFRGRGWNPSGATLGWNHRAPAIAWVGGSGGTMTDAAFEAAETLWRQVYAAIDLTPRPGMGHKDVRDTACPGPEYYPWIHDHDWITPPTLEDDMFLQEGDKAFAVVKYKKALNAWAAATGANIPPLELGSTFDTAMGDAVEAYHRASQLDDIQWMTTVTPAGMRRVYGITADLLNEYNPDHGSGGGDLSYDDVVRLARL
jgi:hypothetical protein